MGGVSVRFGLVRGAALAAAVFVAGGCGAPVIITSAGLTAAQVGASEFADGDLESAHAATFNDVFAAAVAAVEDLGYLKIHSSFGERVGTIRAYELGGTRLEVLIEKRTEVITTMAIRVGVFGDQSLSRLVLANIQARLPAVPALPPITAEEAPTQAP